MKLTFGQMMNQPDFVDYRDFCKELGVKQSSAKALREFIDYNSVKGIDGKDVYEYEPYFINENFDKITLASGEKHLSIDKYDRYVDRNDSPPTIYELVDKMYEYIKKCAEENRK